jgi:hypothetical protein
MGRLVGWFRRPWLQPAVPYRPSLAANALLSGSICDDIGGRLNRKIALFNTPEETVHMAGMFGENPLIVLIAVGLVVLAAVVFALMTAGF